MKTYILKLEVHDDILSTRDKIGWVKGGRLLVVWPERGQVLNRRLDLVLLQRHSAALGAQLALVSRDPDVRYYAPRLGIPVFKSLRHAQSDHWRVPHRFRQTKTDQPITETTAPDSASATLSNAASSPAQPDEPLSTRERLRRQQPYAVRPAVSFSSLQPPRPLSTDQIPPAIRLLSFALAMVSLLAIAAVLLPTAEVHMTPKIGWQESVINVQASQEITQVALSGSLPAHRAAVTVEGRDSSPVSGSILLPDRPATGAVEFTNLTDQKIKVPQDAIVLTRDAAPLRFTVTQAGEIAAGPGKTITLPVRCLSLGSQGNLPAGKLVAIEGLLGTQVSATNPQPTRNGADRQEPAPNEADRQALSTRLRQTLQQTALTELRDMLATGDLILAASLELVEVQEENYQPETAQPADQLGLSLRAEFQALVVSETDLHSLAKSILDANLPPNFFPLNQTIQIENLSQPTLEAGQARWKLAFRRQVQAQVLKPEGIRLALGQNKEQASQRLTSVLPLASPPHITLSPAWWPRLPILPFRITIKIVQTE